MSISSSDLRARGILFADAHFHSNPLKGYGSEFIAKKFRDSGGWFMALIGLPPTSLDLQPNLEGFRRSLEILLRECERIKSVRGLKTACLGGYHPAMIDKMINDLNLDPREVYEISMRVFEETLRLVEKDLLDGVAEIGRPHYKVSPEQMVLADIIFDDMLKMAKDGDVLVHLHLEEGGWITAIDISRRISKYSLNPWRVIMHHLRPKNLRPAMELGLVATVPALYQIIESIRDLRNTNYVFESDFLDDPRRPGKPLYPWEIIENSLRALRENLINEEVLYKIHVDNIVKIFGVEPP